MTTQTSLDVGDIPDEPMVPEGTWCNQRIYGAPLVTSDRDDSHLDGFVALWHQVYRIFIKIRYLKEAEVVFPPAGTGRHPNIDRARLRDEAGMSERAISLIERLPYPIKHFDGCWDWPPPFVTEGMILNYLFPKEWIIENCRSPHPMADAAGKDGVCPPDHCLLPDDVLLLSSYESFGRTWVLDTKTSTSPQHIG